MKKISISKIFYAFWDKIRIQVQTSQKAEKLTNSTTLLTGHGTFAKYE
jgi:hypothetical protein